MRPFAPLCRDCYQPAADKPLKALAQVPKLDDAELLKRLQALVDQVFA